MLKRSLVLVTSSKNKLHRKANICEMKNRSKLAEPLVLHKCKSLRNYLESFVYRSWVLKIIITLRIGFGFWILKEITELLRNYSLSFRLRKKSVKPIFKKILRNSKKKKNFRFRNRKKNSVKLKNNLPFRKWTKIPSAWRRNLPYD